MAGQPVAGADHVTLFLCGDVMTGRGIDQILPTPGDPLLHEPSMHDARDYVSLAERRNGPLPRSVSGSYLWGDALDELDRISPAVRIVNLETAITTCDEFDRGKCIHYRMHPANVGGLTAAGIDCCTLGNNHVLDWGREGLAETLATLSRAGIGVAGAGRDLAEARRPSVHPRPGGGRVLVFACGCESAGVPPDWAADERRSGVWLIDEDSTESVAEIAARVSATKRPGDVVVLSVHWGDNWGYEIPSAQRRFAMRMIDDAGVDVVCGHSSHHVKGIEVHHGRLILYGCGDLLTDYEGIAGREEYRDDLGLLYFVTLDHATGELLRVEMCPTRLQGFQLRRPAVAETDWLFQTLDRECRRLGTSIARTAEDRLTLEWPGVRKRTAG